MEQFVANVVDQIREGKVIFLLVGPSGAGKSFLTEKLKTALHKPSVHCLDDYRITCNNGEYPDSPQVHDRINQVAIPMYREAVLKDRHTCIILDNTHLRWDPDWQLALQKAKRDHYDIFPIVPPASEFLLHTCRSTHLGDGPRKQDIFRKMCARFPGHRMRHFLNRRISCSVLDEIFPLKPDSFYVNKMFHIGWGSDGYLYVHDNYLGYVDRNMVIHAVKAGNYLKCVHDGDDVFLCKDGLLHITLVPPGKPNSDTLKNLAREMVRLRSDPPSINYRGIHEMTEEREHKKNRLIFLSIARESNGIWKNVVDQARIGLRIGNPHIFNPDGIHVTLGFSRSDIWGVDKLSSPKWFIDQATWDSLPDVFHWKLGSPLTESNLLDELNVASNFTDTLEGYLKKIGYHEDLTISVPPELSETLGLLFLHPEVKLKWKQCAKEKEYHMLNVQVSPPRFRSDDETYKKYPLLLKTIPRSLTHAFRITKASFKYVGSAFPTPKFFGDNDLEEDVQVISDDNLKTYEYDRDKCSQHYVVTEKANGEMFTFSVIDREHDGDGSVVNNVYVVIMGSKNNKFLFKLHPEFPEDSVDEGIQAQLLVEGKLEGYTEKNMENNEWTNNNLWVEMCSTFASIMSKMGVLELDTLLSMLLQTKKTLCGEFESYLHPHLVKYPPGHRNVVFFATTTFSRNFECVPCNALSDLALLDELEEKYKLSTVSHRKTHDNLLKIKNDIRNKRKKEGVVVLVIKDGKVVDRVKLKTIWYVVHRGFREKLRKMITAARKSRMESYLKAADVEKILMTTLKEKLAIFSVNMYGKEAKEYSDYVRRLSSYVSEQSLEDFYALTREFLYDYPGMIERVECAEDLDKDKGSIVSV